MKLRKFLSLTLALLITLTAVPAFDVVALASSKTMPYRIDVDITNQIVTIYSNADNSIVRQMMCSTGLDNSTPLGTYRMPSKDDPDERTEWYYFRAFNVYARYATRVYKGILFHSIPYNRKRESSISEKDVAVFGKQASHGCVRLRWQDAKFIAENCLKGTKVKFYKSGEKDSDLRELLYQSSYTGENGMTYRQFLGIPDEEGVLGRFCEGSEVLDFQYRLRDLGVFSDTISGEYRSTTINAVKQVQKLLGEEQTGIASLELQELIYSNEAPTAMNVALSEGMNGPVVRELQQNMAQLQLYDGDIDGVYDIDVIESVKVFQRIYGYTVNGVASTELQKAIYYEAGKTEALFTLNAGYTSEIVTETLYMGKVSSEVGIRIREKATTESAALGRLTDGDIIILLDHGDTWSKIQRGDSIGYIKNVYVNYFKREISALKFTATDDDRVYTIGYTAEGYYSGAQMPSSVFAEYLATDGLLDDYEGLADFVTIQTEGAGVTLNLRESPSTSSNIIAELPNGIQLKVLLRSSEWSLVSYEDANGYLLNQYLEFWTGPEDALSSDSDELPEDDNVDAVLHAVVKPAEAEKAPVYDIDSDDAAILGHLANGVSLDVLETVNGWSLISYKGYTGYMKDADLHFVVDEEDASTV